MKNAQKTKLTNSRRTSRGLVPGCGPAVEKHCSKAKLKSNGNSASHCFKSFLIRNMSGNWLPTQTLL